MEETEREELRNRAQERPNCYIEHGEDNPVSVGRIRDKDVVIGCPCGELAKIEAEIWADRHAIAEYLKARSEAESQRASGERREFADILKRTN